VRFHGFRKLYASNYTKRRLETWACRLRELEREVKDVWVYFNNDAHGYAPANARILREILD
jgi:uncharacterized protein YecE (DUF72 family)